MNIYEQTRNNLNTGDLVIFSNQKSITSNVIKFLTGSQWTHVGMVIKFSTPFNFVALWESDFELGGVQLTNLSVRIKKYPGQVMIRQLKDHKIDSNKLEKIRNDLKLRPFQINRMEMIRAVFDSGRIFSVMQERNLESLFCSELVAETLQQCGVLDSKISSNEYVPKDFMNELPLLQGTYDIPFIVKLL